MDFTEETPRAHDFTIQGVTGLTVIQPFADGHSCSTNEANALNQTVKENVRNNCAKKVSEMKEAAEKAGKELDKAAVQAMLDGYMAGYNIGERRGRTAVIDPVEREAYALCEKKVKEKLKAQGQKISELDPDALEQTVKNTLDKHPIFREKAQKIIDERAEMEAVSI